MWGWVQQLLREAGHGNEGLKVKPGVKLCLQSPAHHKNYRVKWNREQEDTWPRWELRVAIFFQTKQGDFKTYL